MVGEREKRSSAELVLRETVRQQPLGLTGTYIFTGGVISLILIS